MSKYIDASKLKAEIERRKELLTPHKGQGVILCREIIKQFDSLLSFIYTISQPIMKDDIIDEIRAEIERRFSEYNHDSNHHVQAAECASILDFLSNLESEESVPNDLEKAAKEYEDALGYYECMSQWPSVAFIAGAKWQAEQLLKSSPLPEDTVMFNKGVAEGRRLMMVELSEHIAAAYQLGLAANNPNIELKAELIHTTDTAQVDGKELLYVSDKSYKIGWRDCKEQMMKEAVEGLFQNTPFPTICLDDCKNYDFKDGDKVRVIVLPKED